MKKQPVQNTFRKPVETGLSKKEINEIIITFLVALAFAISFLWILFAPTLYMDAYPNKPIVELNTSK